MSDTRVFSLILLLAAGAIAVGATHILQLIVRDIVDRAREEDTSDTQWFE